MGLAGRLDGFAFDTKEYYSVDETGAKQTRSNFQICAGSSLDFHRQLPPTRTSTSLAEAISACCFSAS